MSRQKNLEEWKIDEFGGPEFTNTRDAIHYARLAFWNRKYLDLLKTKLLKLKRFIADNEPTSFNEMKEISIISGEIGFVNDAIREVVSLRLFSNEYLDAFFRFRQSCPFCDHKLIDHDEFGNCPQ